MKIATIALAAGIAAAASIGGPAYAGQCPVIFEGNDLTTLRCADGRIIDIWRDDTYAGTHTVISQEHKICASTGPSDGNSVMATCY
jgi:hypothetical protein